MKLNSPGDVHDPLNLIDNKPFVNSLDPNSKFMNFGKKQSHGSGWGYGIGYGVMADQVKETQAK